jgi:hypothetical protein
VAKLGHEMFPSCVLAVTKNSEERRLTTSRGA